MDTTTLERPPVMPVGEDIDPRDLHRGDIVLIEERTVRGDTVGRSRDVVAEVSSPPCLASDLLVVEWEGAARGADNSVGVAAFDCGGHVTRLAVAL